MTNKDLFLMSCRNILNNKLKFILVIISICIGISSVTIISSIGDIAKKSIASELDNMGIDGLSVIDISGEDLIDEEFFKKVETSFNADLVMPIVNEFGGYTNNRISGTCVVWGVESNVDELLKLNILHGNVFENDDITKSENVILIDESLANKLYRRSNIVGKTLSLTINSVREDYEIIGVIADQKAIIDTVFGDSSPSFIYAPITTISQISGKISYDQIAIRSDENLLEVKDSLEFYIEKNDEYFENFTVQNISSYVDIVNNVIKYISLLLTFIAGISMIVASVGVINIILSSTIERKKEIGVYLALGAKKVDVAKIFLLESVLICTFSGLLGTIIGVLIVLLVTHFILVEFYISFVMLITIISLSITCGILSGIFPSIKASKLNPIDVLRE